MKKLFFFFYALILLGCNSDEILNSEKIYLSELKKQWIHSREEETDSVQIYRPIDYKEFPASHYRQVYFFADSDKCKYLVLAPNDAHYYENGTWIYSEDNQILAIYDSSQQAIMEFKIISVTKNQLKFVQIK